MADFFTNLKEFNRRATERRALPTMTINSITLLLVAVLSLLAGCNRREVGPETGHHDHPAGQHGTAHSASPGPAASRTPPLLSGAKCASHDAPKELCFICDPKLREKGRLWCEEHKRYEDRCFICHPELQDTKRLWCKEHSLYEDECFLCHPELRSNGKPTAAAPGAPLVCAEHGVPEAECAICQPELASRLKPGESMKVRLPSINSTAFVGVQTGMPGTGAVADGIECIAEVIFNQNKLAQIAAPVRGVIQGVQGDLGMHVEEKQTVATIWSASIAEAVAKAVLSHQTLERERKLRADRVTSQAGLEEAEAAHRSACQQLRTQGFTEEQIEELSRQPQEQVLMEVRAPFAGEIVERTAVRGALVEAGKQLFTVVDLSTVWAMLHVPEAALTRVKLGQRVELRLDSAPDKVFKGELTWIGQAVDERTRMARARAEFANTEGLLKDKMFATAKILTREAQRAVACSRVGDPVRGGKAIRLCEARRGPV